MKKYRIVSVSAVSATIACLFISASSSLAATSLTSVVQTNIYGGGASASSSANVNVGINGSYNSNNDATSTSEMNTGDNGIINANVNIGSNDAQLNAYAQAIAENDPSVSAVSTTDNNVSISYKVPVKLFGFIPVYETETISVDTSVQGSAPHASVHRSWWSFLAAGNNSGNVAAFSSNLNDSLSASASGSSQTQIMAEIEAAARSSMSASATASASGSASTGY